MEGGTAPRVNKQTMSAYGGRVVALVGAVESHLPTAVVLRTSVCVRCVSKMSLDWVIISHFSWVDGSVCRTDRS